MWEECGGKEYVLEEEIAVEPSLRSFHPASANALRVVTINTRRGPEVLCAYARLGNGGQCVEHLWTGAIAAAIDLDTGIVCTQGYDLHRNRFTVHPVSGKTIPGYRFANWEGCLRLVKEMALVVPGTRMVGWDMVIDENRRWQPIEGNHNCGFMAWQICMHEGLADRIESIIEDDRCAKRSSEDER